MSTHPALKETLRRKRTKSLQTSMPTLNSILAPKSDLKWCWTLKLNRLSVSRKIFLCWLIFTAVEIIQSLKDYNSPAASEQLFKTLTETSQAIKKMPAEGSGSDEDNQDTQSKKSSMSVESQLKLLLEKLNANKLSSASSEQGESTTQSLNGSISAQLNSGPNAASHSQRITDAYKLINEVIMIPQIMWSRNFFYSLSAMSAEQQSIVHGWFQEMNEVCNFSNFFNQWKFVK